MKKALAACWLLLSAQPAAAGDGALSVSECVGKFFKDDGAYFSHIAERVSVRGQVVEVHRCPSCASGLSCKPCSEPDSFVLADRKGGPRLKVCRVPAAAAARDVRRGDVVVVEGELGLRLSWCEQGAAAGELVHERSTAEGGGVILESEEHKKAVDVEFAHAVATGEVAKAAALLDQGAAIEGNAPGWDTPLCAAAARGDLPMLHLLLRRGARLEAKGDHGRTPLLAASHEGKATSLSALLTAGATPAAVGSDGKSALVLAAEKGYLDVLELLLAAGADKNARVQSGPEAGRSALLGAVEAGHAAVALALVRAGADVSAADASGRTALHECGFCPLEVCQALLERGAPLEARTGAGATPLLSAASSGAVEVVSLLLARGADARARTNDGRGALQLAEQGGHSGAAAVLRGKGER